MAESITTHSSILKEKSSDSTKNIITAAKGGGITFAGRLFEYFISLIFVVMVSRLLGPGPYGLYRLTLSIVMVVSALCLLGLEGGISRFIPIFLTKNDKAGVRGVAQIGIGLPVFIGIALSVIIAFSSEQIAASIFTKPEISFLLRLMAIAIPMMVLIRCLSSIAVGFKKVQYEVYSQAIGFSLFKLCLTVFAIYVGFGVQGTIVAYVVSVALSLGILLYFVRSLYPFTINPKKARLNFRELFRYSFPFYLSRVLDQFKGQFETMVLGSFGLLADVGIYAVILTVSNFGKMGYESMGKISIPIFAELHSQGKYSELERYYQTVTKWGLTFTLPIFLAALLFGDTLLLVFGEKFTVGVTGLIILMAAILLDSTTGLIGLLINVTGYTKLGFINSVIYFIITLVLDFLFIPRWYLIGACLAAAITLVIMNVLRIFQVYFILEKIIPFNRSFLKPIGSAILAAALTFGLKNFVLVNYPIIQCALLLILMSAIYFILIIAFRLSPEDRFIIDKISERLKIGKLLGRFLKPSK